MKKGIHEFEGTPGELIARLELAQQEDRKAERRGGVFGCGGALLFFLGVGLLGLSTDISWLAWPGAFCLVGAVVCIPLFFRADSQDLEDLRYLEPLRLLRVLRTDLPADRPLRLKIDFRDYPWREFQVTRTPEGGGRTRLTYRQPWLDFQGRLADGARFCLEVVRKAERLESYKTRRGKTRRRWRDKVQDRIFLQLQVPGLDLGNLVANLSPGLPSGMTGRDMKIQGNMVRMVVETPQARRTMNQKLGPEDLASGDRLLALLLWVYQGVGRLRASAGQPG